jgi:putative spermidine/putrescine transport system permease protein
MTDITVSDPAAARSAPPTSGAGIRLPTQWLGVAPFFLFATMFLLLPVAFLVIGSFRNAAGQLTTQNYVDLTRPDIASAFTATIEISLVTAVLGGLFGFLLAYALVLGRLPSFLRTSSTTFAGVASNFAGVPLALAFIYTLGQLGIVTVFLKDTFGFNLYQNGFTIYSKIGLEIVYLYFQIPLMVLIMAPAIDGLKREWLEAAENLGATSRQYWRHVALPVLMPTLLATMVLLFGNAFGAYATAYQLTGGTLNILGVKIGAQISGDVLHNEGLGYAMAMGMVIVMGLAITTYVVLQRRAERWRRA